MFTPVYEEQVMCDNCGAVVESRVVDAGRFGRDAEALSPAMPELDESGGTLVDDGDLIAEEGAVPVEVLLRHVGSCPHCAGT